MHYRMAGIIVGAGFFIFSSQPGPAQAGLLGDVIRHGAGARFPGGPEQARHRHHYRGGGESDDEDSSGSDSGRKPKTAAEVIQATANFFARQQEDLEKQRADQLEKQRNVDKAIDKFITTLKNYHSWLKEHGVSGSTEINQVTAGELRTSLEEAYRQGRLFEFERYAGELWTRDRLMVLTLRYAEEGLLPYFHGVGAKGPSVEEIRSLLAKSAREVHATALEVGEMVGVSLSYDRFIRTIYESSDRASEGYWKEGADTQYERAGTQMIDIIPREKFINKATLEADSLGLEKQFLYRYRARRTLYDCLNSKYPAAVSNKGAAQPDSGATNAERKGFAPVRKTQDASKAESGQPLVPGDKLWNLSGGLVDRLCHNAPAMVASLVNSGKVQPESARTDTSNMPQTTRGDDTGGDETKQ
ncbi:MAG: hypothetical protein ACLP7P_17070 [Rhodomicrobium sp.]